MRRRLSLKLLLAYAAFAGVTFWFIALLGSSLFRQTALRREAERLYEEALEIVDLQAGSYTGSRTVDPEQLGSYAAVSGNRLLILNTGCTVTFDSAGALTGHTLSAFDPAGSEDFYRVGSFGGIFTENTLSVFAPVTAGLQPVGYVTLHRSMSGVEELADAMLRKAYEVFAGILLLSLSLLLVQHFTVVRPLKAVTKGVEHFTSGDLEYRIPVRHHDEIGYLSDALNTMAGDLADAGRYQKKFISNVSHDFRSPLTSIRGYLQAMQDGVIAPGEQGPYLQIVLDETERLTGLTQKLLALGSMEEKKLLLSLEDFDLVDLIRRTCRTFEGVCTERGIHFELIFYAPAVPVRADSSRIQQVLYNLIDNAVKFSRDGDPIRIQVYELGEKAGVSVKDFGIGIPREELGKIWNRFYKADNSRGRDKKGSGLGLAIVKEALADHGERIDVTSTPGSGTEFIFRLPLAVPQA